VELKPDVVLMDLSMPNMGGIEATRQLSRIEPDTRILILTVHEDESLLREVIRSGAAGYIIKRADESELVHAIRVVARGDMYVHPALTRVLFAPDKPPSFDLGLVPGVFLGSFVAAALFGELKLEGFAGGASMRRYLVGAVLMGFGGMTAGGCAVGAGLSGAAVFTITSWVTLVAMWGGAAITDRLVDQHGEEAAQPNLGDQPVPHSRAFT
jgi:hypothetical protein